VKFSGIAWTEDGRASSTAAIPNRPPGKALEAAIRDKKIFYHVLARRSPPTS